MTEITGKLSHIIINVDKNIPKDHILAFCTNVQKENSEIRFTYLCYDNQIPKDDVRALVELLNSDPENAGSLFIITDSESAASYTIGAGIACAALSSENNRSLSFPGILYRLEDIEFIPYSRIERMWQRFNNIPWIITETERLMIREQTVSDIEALYGIYSDKEITKYTEDLYEDPDREREYLQNYIDNQYRFYEYGIWAVILKDTNELIGRAGISIREGYDIPEVGYVIGKRFQGRGYAKEAVNAIIGYAEEELGLYELIAFTKEKNAPSVRLLKSMGFVKRGKVVINGGAHAMYLLTKQQ